MPSCLDTALSYSLIASWMFSKAILSAWSRIKQPGSPGTYEILFCSLFTLYVMAARGCLLQDPNLRHHVMYTLTKIVRLWRVALCSTRPTSKICYFPLTLILCHVGERRRKQESGGNIPILSTISKPSPNFFTSRQY